MSTQYKTIKAKIKTELETITEIKTVYDYKKGDLNGYPVACIEEMNGNSEQLSVATAYRTMIFSIKIYQEMEKSGVGTSEAEDRITTIIDKLWDLFDNDWKLDCNVDDAFINRISTGWDDREISMRIVELELTIKKTYELT